MDLLSVYQTVYTVSFVLSGVFFAMTVTFFFLFHIRDVYGNLYGGRNKAQTVNMVGVRRSKRKRREKESFDGDTVPSPNMRQMGTVPQSGQATVMTRFLETVMDEPEGTISTQASDGSGKKAIGETVLETASARERIGFRPEVKILEFSARDKI